VEGGSVEGGSMKGGSVEMECGGREWVGRREEVGSERKEE